MGKLLSTIALIIMLSPCVSTAEGIPVEHLSALIETALNNNPELKSSESRWKMYLAKVGQATSLDDPMLMFKLQNMVIRDPVSFDKDPTTARVVGLSQQLPFPGKRALRGEIAGYEAESWRWQAEERKLELRRMVSETYFQLYAIDRALEIVAKNLRIMGDFTIIAESRYTVGQGAQADIFKAGLEKTRMLEMQITLQQQRKSLEAGLNNLLARPSGTPVGQIPDFQLPVVSSQVTELEALALKSRPLLKSLNSRVRKGAAVGELARKESYPDFNLSLEYMYRVPVMGDPGYDMYSAAVTFNLPFQKGRREAMLTEATAETSMAGEELASLKNIIAAAIGDSLAQLERRRRLVELYRGGIIPQAEQALESALINYRVGKVDFLALLESRLTLQNYERELYDASAEYMMALARLEAAVGVELLSNGGEK